MCSIGVECKADVSVIIPVFNAENWIQECLKSIEAQNSTLIIEVSIFNDSSTDNSSRLIKQWIQSVSDKSNMKVVYSEHSNGCPKGCGFAKNKAVLQSSAPYLCFQDSDDVMTANRIEVLYKTAMKFDINRNLLIGSRFHRIPEDSTKRFTEWANNLTQAQLYTNIYTSHGPSLIMPTWFCSRNVFNRINGFDESGKGAAEDLIFFYKHLDCGGELMKVDEDLLLYRYHLQQTTFSVSEQTIWNLRLERFQRVVLSEWNTFCIWNAGKEGKRLYRSLSPENRQKVVSFCDVDAKKIRKGFYTFEESSERVKPRVPIVHFTEAQPPFVICVKLGLTKGMFESNLRSLCLTDGIDYFHFG
ncbi:UDP-GlcNAc:betaGal beta-1:3-N-acetylglucosaminyltransferase-like protein 1 [Leptotrombidium deliense]|uniref:UDP-GlcNAc:betaGal beta-1:3-N-acetylglucosaminyltransferase-like protein 1 n=1 Tax=Leptotrombidium deliense TaxID=299467 RepID=A0A443S2R8_9ACAR|nr:UDP-GlcNAc:betaGal beta-1:3-N-acetylglucosaminyltransferase-like protein 1 [Leptotrombidium deliense]